MSVVLCECGCGQPAPLAPDSNQSRGYEKGKPRRFVHGHNRRGRKHPSPPPKGSDNPGWRGGRYIKDGYVRVRVGRGHPMATPQGWAYEHRLVMAEHLGRWLEPEEHVHHRNGDKQDNRIENLELFPNAAAHMAHHKMLERLGREWLAQQSQPSTGIA